MRPFYANMTSAQRAWFRSLSLVDQVEYRAMHPWQRALVLPAPADLSRRFSTLPLEDRISSLSDGDRARYWSLPLGKRRVFWRAKT